VKPHVHFNIKGSWFLVTLENALHHEEKYCKLFFSSFFGEGKPFFVILTSGTYRDVWMKENFKKLRFSPSALDYNNQKGINVSKLAPQRQQEGPTTQIVLSRMQFG
jgi:hypothetical protein